MPFKSLNFLLPALLALFLAPVRAEDDAPTVEFYFSDTDPHLAATEKLLTEAMKKFPGIPLERLPLDDKKNAKRLTKQEKNLEMKSVGEMTVIFGPYYLNSKGTTRDIETFFVPMMERLVKQSKGDMTHKDRLKTDVAAYAKEIYGDGATPVDPPAAAKFEANIFYEIKKDGKRAGWVIDGYDPIGCPVCSATQFLLAADPKGTILGVKPVHAIERIGLKLTDAETETFVKQFKGKKAGEEVKPDGISRATKTVKAYTSSINEILEELKNRTKE